MRRQCRGGACPAPRLLTAKAAGADFERFGQPGGLAADLDLNVVGLAPIVTLLAIVGKATGRGLGGYGKGVRSMAIVGVGMAPRGEVGLTLANVGQSIGAVPDVMFSTVVIMSLLTTLVVLTALYGSPAAPPREEQKPDYAVADGRLPGL